MKQTPITYFSRAEILFSTKTFTAAMLALYLANVAGLSHPFWAMTTAYIVSSPLAAGAVRSKAMDRFIGTFIGALGAVLIVPIFNNSRSMTVLAMSIWCAACLFISLTDRTARSYAFMLGGVTAAVVGFPSVQAPFQGCTATQSLWDWVSDYLGSGIYYVVCDSSVSGCAVAEVV